MKHPSAVHTQQHNPLKQKMSTLHRPLHQKRRRVSWERCKESHLSQNGKTSSPQPPAPPWLLWQQRGSFSHVTISEVQWPFYRLNTWNSSSWTEPNKLQEMFLWNFIVSRYLLKEEKIIIFFGKCNVCEGSVVQGKVKFTCNSNIQYHSSNNVPSHTVDV